MVPAARAVRGAGAPQGHGHQAGSLELGEQPWDSTGHAEGILPLGCTAQTRSSLLHEEGKAQGRQQWSCERKVGDGSWTRELLFAAKPAQKEGKALYKMHTRPSHQSFICPTKVLSASPVTESELPCSDPPWLSIS